MKIEIIGAIAISAMGLIYGAYLTGISKGEENVAAQYANRENERQRKITNLTISLNHAEKKIDEQLASSLKVVRNAKNACGDDPVPPDVAEQLR